MSATPQISTPTSSKPRVRKDLGMLMFLLAAETAVVSSIADSPQSPTTDFASKSIPSMPSETSSRNGETDSATRTPSPEDDEEMLLEELNAGAWQGRMATKVLVFDNTLVSQVLSFIPWKEVTLLRAVNTAWQRAAETIVQIRNLPGTMTPAAFLPCPKDLEQDTKTEAALQFTHPSTWRCVVCGFWNAESRVLCGNRQCQSPSLTHAGCARIFLGQLRRDATVPFIKWLVNRVLESPSELRNVENHRHNVTNRGKGCAWAYFKSDLVANQLLAYHRRMFLDNVDGTEGLWIVKKSETEALNQVASVRGYVPQRPKCLPRNALVVETPATGSSQMGRELLHSNLDVQCQYAEEPAPAPVRSPPMRSSPAMRSATMHPRPTRSPTVQSRGSPQPSPAMGPKHARTNSAGSTAPSVAGSEYRHNPYGYSPTTLAAASVPAYQWPGGNLTLPEAEDLAASPPGYNESALMSAQYGSPAAQQQQAMGYATQTYYRTGPAYAYDQASYAYYPQ